MNKNTSKEIFDILNKGVPADTPVILSSLDLINFSNNQNITKKIIDNSFFKYMGFVENIVGDDKVVIDFSRSLEIGIDYDTLDKKIQFSFSAFIASLFYGLNVGGISSCNLSNNGFGNSIYIDSDINVLKEKLIERISVLSSVNNEKNLKRKFPVLYNKYCYISEMYRSILELESYINKKLDSEFGPAPSLQKLMFRGQIIEENKRHMEKYDDVENFDYNDYLKKAKVFTFEGFIEENSKGLTKIINNLDNILEYLKDNVLDLKIFKYIDKEKLELYIVHRNLVYAEVGEDKQQYLYYVSNYFFENADKIDSDLRIVCGDVKEGEATIFTGGKNQVITPRMVYDRYKKLLVHNPNLQIINLNKEDFSNMSLNEVEEFMNEYLKSLSANWEFLSGNDNNIDNKVLNGIKSSYSKLTDEERKQKQDKLLDLYLEKKTFFDTSDPFYRIQGKNTFDGYIGYIYSNGKVVLEKLFDNVETGKLTSGQAIYVMDMDQFYNLSQLSKNEIIRNKLCKRFVHRGNWQEKVLMEIKNEECKCRPEKATFQLIKDKKIIKDDNC